MAPSQEDHQETQPPPAPPAAPPAESRYPPGYRFAPTDCELIQEYLQKKVHNEPIPISDIKDTILRLKNPMELADAAELPMIGQNEWYFFTPRDRKYPNGKRPDRAAGSGYWKATGNDKEVEYEERVIGFRRSLVFYQGRPMRGEKTNWIMHEFTLNQTPCQKTMTRQKTKTCDMRLDDWVLCRIHKKSPSAPKKAKKRKSHTQEEEGGGGGGGGVDGVGVTTNNLDHRDHNTTSVQYCNDDQQHEQPYIDDHFNNNSYYQQHEQQQPPGQYYSHQQHEQHHPNHHHVNNDDGLDFVSSFLNDAYLNEQAAVTGFHEVWSNEAFPPSYNANNSNSNASCNDESAPDPANINNNSPNYGGGKKRSM